jgi:hypothetical protein
LREIFDNLSKLIILHADFVNLFCDTLFYKEDIIIEQEFFISEEIVNSNNEITYEAKSLVQFKYK